MSRGLRRLLFWLAFGATVITGKLVFQAVLGQTLTWPEWAVFFTTAWVANGLGLWEAGRRD